MAILNRYAGAVVLAVLAPVLAWAVPADPFHVSASLTVGPTSALVAVTFAVPPAHHLYADELRVREAGGRPLVPVTPGRPEKIHDALSDMDREAYTEDFTLVYRADGVITGLTVEVDYQGCNASTCFFPQHRSFPLVPGAGLPPGPGGVAAPASVGPAAAGAGAVPGDAWHVVARAVGYLRASEFLAFLDAGEPGTSAGPVAAPAGWARVRESLRLFSASPLEFFNRFGVVWTLLLILVGGLLLNLTPCVLPMIPVNLAILGIGTQGSSRTRGLKLGAAYGAGIALVYGALGLVVVLTGSQFGALNSRPGFNAVIALVFVLLGLAMFDVFQIDLTRFQAAGSPASGRRATLAAAAGMGGVAALLAGACVAPVVIAVLVLSSNLYAGGVGIGLALPFVLGLGMALPWPLAGAGLSFLPKPGAWMTRVKYGFGVFIMALALYYAWVAVQGWRGPRAGQVSEQAGVTRLSADQGPAAWADVARQAAATGKPVLVDFWATWCKNCEAMEASTFRDAAVRARLQGFVVVKCQAERPDEPATRETLERFGVKGLPTYVIVRPEMRRGTPP